MSSKKYLLAITLFITIFTHSSIFSQLNPKNVIPDETPTFLKDAPTKPNFGVCHGIDDYDACIARYLIQEISSHFHLILNRKEGDVIYSQFYFEISPESKIVNVHVESEHEIARLIIEMFLKERLKVIEPAKDADEKPIATACYLMFKSTTDKLVERDFTKKEGR